MQPPKINSSHALRGNSAKDAPRPVTQSVTNSIPTQSVGTMTAGWHKYQLNFHRPATTSRGSLRHKFSWFLIIQDLDTQKTGIGECSVLPILSPDDRPDFESKLTEVCTNIPYYRENPQALNEFPAIQFGLETALLALKHNNRVLFSSAFTEGQQSIPINGLIWMADIETMWRQVEDKVANGFRCLKLKIGALDFKQEYDLLTRIRRDYDAEKLEIRLDANGAFSPEQALDKLQQLAKLDIHSIEQPIAKGKTQVLAELVVQSPIPIALDEELIGITHIEQKNTLLEQVKPDYLILKPSLLGGFAQTQNWIDLALQHGINWWVTSALESNLGLNALAQWTATLNNPLPQGLGTGLLYSNNLPSALSIQQARLHFAPNVDLDKR